jgi:PAS domain S-box-containing protein
MEELHTPARLNCAVPNTTDREEADHPSRDSDVAAVNTLLEAAHDAVLAHNTSGRIVFVNAAAEAVFGYKRQEMIDRPLAMLIPERFRKKCGRHLESFFRSGVRRPRRARLNLIGLRKDGLEFPADIGWSYFETKSGKWLALVLLQTSPSER